MKIKKFFKRTQENLGLNPSDEDISKKKKLILLLDKLNANLVLIKKELLDNPNDEKKEELEEELLVYKLQIKKGQKILDKKNEK